MFSNNTVNNNYHFKLTIFILTHIVVWTVLPSILFCKLHVNAIDNYACGVEFQMGYYKHPPFSSWIIGLWFKIFPVNNFFFFLLEQINRAIGFIFLYLLALKMLPKNKAYLSVILLELIHFYTFSTTFRADALQHETIQLSLWPMAMYFFYLSIFYDKTIHWILLAFSCVAVVLSRYSGGILLITFFCTYILLYKKLQLTFFKKNIYICMLTFLIFLLPHIVWEFEQWKIAGPSCLNYALNIRYSVDNAQSIKRFLSAPYLLYTQFLFLLPITLIGYFVLKIRKKSFVNLSSSHHIFVLCMTFLPFIELIFVGVLKQCWIPSRFATPLWGCIGIFTLLIANDIVKHQEKIIEKIVYGFISIFVIGTLFFKGYQIITKTEPFPYDQLLAKHITNDWHKTYNKPLKYSSDYYFSFYSPDHPSTLLYLDYNVSTWIKEEDIKKNGMVILLNLDQFSFYKPNFPTTFITLNDDYAKWIKPKTKSKHKIPAQKNDHYLWVENDVRTTTINDKKFCYVFIPPEEFRK